MNSDSFPPFTCQPRIPNVSLNNHKLNTSSLSTPRYNAVTSLTINDGSNPARSPARARKPDLRPHCDERYDNQAHRERQNRGTSTHCYLAPNPLGVLPVWEHCAPASAAILEADVVHFGFDTLIDTMNRLYLTKPVETGPETGSGTHSESDLEEDGEADMRTSGQSDSQNPALKISIRLSITAPEDVLSGLLFVHLSPWWRWHDRNRKRMSRKMRTEYTLDDDWTPDQAVDYGGAFLRKLKEAFVRYWTTDQIPFSRGDYRDTRDLLLEFT